MSYTANKVAEMVEHANQLQAALTAAAERETKLEQTCKTYELSCTALREENERLTVQSESRMNMARNLADRVATVESALAAERQKVQALRAQVEAVIASPVFTDSVRQSYRNMLIAMDALGLTPDPPREK